MRFRNGIGYDVHQLRKGRKLILGGVNIPFEKGLYGHSDADVLIHALIDAILGALALPDIGNQFPDSNPEFRNVNSRLLLRKTAEFMHSKNYQIGNIDVTVCAQKPKLQPYIPQMRKNLAEDLQTDINNVSVKATTEEHLGISGSEKGMTALAIVLLYQD